MTGGEQSGEGFRGEENPEVGDEEVEQRQRKPAYLNFIIMLVMILCNEEKEC